MTEIDASVTAKRPRMLVPDVARGLALLGIAIANVATAWLLFDKPTPAAFFGGITGDSLADKIAIVFAAITAHNRGLPMFATLLGFGIGLISLSLARREFPIMRARTVIAKRYAFLALFGATHLLFLFSGDVMFLYGVCGVAIAALIDLQDRQLRVIYWIPLVIIALIGLVSLLLLGQTASSTTKDPASLGGTSEAATYLSLLWTNLKVLFLAVVTLPVSTFFYFPVMLLGFVWARKGVLADVSSHRPLLIRWLVVALVISFGVGLPWGLAAIGVLPQQFEESFMLVNSSIGVFTGPGILAGLALALEPLQRRIHAGAPIPPWMTAIVALGKRSMTGYLLQSVLFAILVYPFMLDFPRGLGTAIQTGVAFAVWLVTLFIAWAMEARGMQGPFEKMHRRISYGPTMRAELKHSK